MYVYTKHTQYRNRFIGIQDNHQINLMQYKIKVQNCGFNAEFFNLARHMTFKRGNFFIKSHDCNL